MCWVFKCPWKKRLPPPQPNSVNLDFVLFSLQTETPGIGCDSRQVSGSKLSCVVVRLLGNPPVVVHCDGFVFPVVVLFSFPACIFHLQNSPRLSCPDLLVPNNAMPSVWQFCVFDHLKIPQLFDATCKYWMFYTWWGKLWFVSVTFLVGIRDTLAPSVRW